MKKFTLQRSTMFCDAPASDSLQEDDPSWKVCHWVSSCCWKWKKHKQPLEAVVFLKRSSKKSKANFSSKTFEGTNVDLFFMVCWAIWRGWPNSIKNHRDQGWPTGSIVAKLATNEWASTTWCLRNPPMITNWNVLKNLFKILNKVYRNHRNLMLLKTYLNYHNNWISVNKW